jgi:type VII secretion ATPase EccA
MASEVLTYFEQGLNQSYVNSNQTSANQNFDWIIGELDATQCDVYLAKAATQDYVSEDLIENAYRTINTYGSLLGQLSLQSGNLVSKFHIPFIGMSHKFQTITDICTAYAVVQMNRGNCAEAINALSRANPPTPMTSIVSGLVYYTAQRWGEVIDAVQPASTALRYDKYDAQTNREDPFVQRLAYLLSGIAYAHLGNIDVAISQLEVAKNDQSGPQDVQPLAHAEAAYWLGLVERYKGNEEAAQTLFNEGMSVIRTENLTKAAADPEIKLRITSVDVIERRIDYWDPNTEPDYEEEQQAAAGSRRAVLLAEADAELDRQIGMSDVKNQVRRLKSSVAVVRERGTRGDEIDNKSLHLIFTGPPGTGKTTIARVVAQAYAGLGVIRNPVVNETSRVDFLGMYQGHTTEKTARVIESSLGGVLFIDEAYSLIIGGKEGGTDQFGIEATTELLRQMDNHRKDLIVILAGYENDINKLIDTNEGFNSRFSRRIRFSSYTPEEIADIAEVMASDRKDIIDSGARQLILDTATTLMDVDHRGRTLIDRAGNGRFARNLVESAEEHKDMRLVASGADLSSLSNDQLATITQDDIRSAVDELVPPILFDDHTVTA